MMKNGKVINNDRSLCDSCATRGCVLQSGVVRKHCDFYTEEAEPCEDAISREEIYFKLTNGAYPNETIEQFIDRLVKELEDMSPVKPVACIAKVKEQEMEKHTDRQIYDGCIHLMQKMVDYFQEYLEYLGYDLDKLDEDKDAYIRQVVKERDLAIGQLKELGYSLGEKAKSCRCVGNSDNKKCRGCHYNDGEVHAECVVCNNDKSKDEKNNRRFL